MEILPIIRAVAFAGFAYCSSVALASWAVTQRKLNPFGRTARLLRRFSDPVMDPVERWQLERGGNPQNAPWWVFGAGLVGAIVLVTATQFLLGLFYTTGSLLAAGPRGIVHMIVYLAFEVVLWALIIRVIGSWFGIGRFRRWMRPVYALTDWIIRPLQRVIPPVGMIDVTPIVAWFVLRLLLSWVMGVV
jgi:YggT family protein